MKKSQGLKVGVALIFMTILSNCSLSNMDDGGLASTVEVPNVIRLPYTPEESVAALETAKADRGRIRSLVLPDAARSAGTNELQASPGDELQASPGDVSGEAEPALIYAVVFVTNNEGEDALLTHYVIYDSLPISELETNAAMAEYGRQQGMLDTSSYTNARPFWAVMTREHAEHFLETGEVVFEPIREVPLSEVADSFSETFLNGMDYEMTNKCLAPSDGGRFREVWESFGGKIFARSSWESPGWRGIGRAIPVGGYIKFNGRSSMYVATPLQAISVKVYQNIFTSYSTYTGSDGYYSTKAKFSTGVSLQITVDMIAEYADAQWEWITNVNSSNGSAFYQNFHFVDSFHFAPIGRSGLLDMFEMVRKCYAFGVSQGLFARFESGIKEIEINVINTGKGGGFDGSSITIFSKNANYYNDPAYISHEYGHLLFYRKKSGDYQDEAHSSMLYLPDGLPRQLNNQQGNMNEGWAMCFSAAFCSTYFPAYMSSDAVLRWIENNYGSPEIVFRSTKTNTSHCAPVIGKITGNYILCVNKLFQYHYASILYDLWDNNSRPHNFTDDGPSLDLGKNEIYVGDGDWWGGIYSQYQGPYSYFTQDRVRISEQSLDTVSVPLSKIFQFTQQWDADTNTSPFSYDSDIFWRLSASGATLGMTAAQIDAISQLHSYSYYVRNDKVFKYSFLY